MWSPKSNEWMGASGVQTICHLLFAIRRTAMFLGEHTHTIDTKGRIAIPAKFRDQLRAGAVITKGLDSNCLFLFPKKEWALLAEKIMALPISQANSRAFSRHLFAGASDVEFDGQGRVLIPDYLRIFAGLQKSVVVAGLYNRVELWDNERWNRYRATTERSSEKIAEQLGGLGI